MIWDSQNTDIRRSINHEIMYIGQINGVANWGLE